MLQLNDIQTALRTDVERKVREGIYRFEDVSCCVCGETSFDPLATRDRYGLYMPVVICRHCGLIQTNPRMTKESYAEFYNTEYLRLYAGSETPLPAFFSSQVEKGARIFDYLSKMTLPKPVSRMSILEVGCGTGGALYYLRKKGCRVKGIDLGKQNAAFGREEHGLDLSTGTLADIHPDEPPDVVIYCHVLEHILEPNVELAQVSQILQEKGLLYVELPGVKDVRQSCNADFLRFLQNAHVYHFTLTSLTNLMRRNCFEMVAGSESINSLFRKRTALDTPPVIVNDYDEVMRYLRITERLRRLRPPAPDDVARVARSALMKSLQLVGLDDVARDIYRNWLRGASR